MYTQLFQHCCIWGSDFYWKLDVLKDYVAWTLQKCCLPMSDSPKIVSDMQLLMFLKSPSNIAERCSWSALVVGFSAEGDCYTC